MTNTLRIHELTEELDPEEAGRMKQRSRVEEAQKLREAREAGAQVRTGTRDDSD